MTTALTKSLVRAIGLYRRYLSPLRPPTCRFIPSCSQYAADALVERGLVVGLVLASWRLLRCGPWSKGGFDPVPLRGEPDGCVQTVHVQEKVVQR
jgi:hypothetical protein